MRNIISNLNKVLFVIGLIASFFAFLPLPQHLYIARIHLNGAVIQTSKGVSDIRVSRRILLNHDQVGWSFITYSV